MTTKLIKARSPLTCWVCASHIEAGTHAVSERPYPYGDGRQRVHAHPACQVVYMALLHHLEADPEEPIIYDFLREALPEMPQGAAAFITEHIDHAAEMMERGAWGGWCGPDELRADLPRLLERYTEEGEP